MANIVFNIAKGRGVELYHRVKNNDPADSALVLVPLESSGLESDAALVDETTLLSVLDGATNEQSTMGRKVLTDANLAAIPLPVFASDYYEVSLPDVVWTSAAGNAVAKILIAYDPSASGGTDSQIIPITMFDASLTPDGTTFTLTSGTFFRAS